MRAYMVEGTIKSKHFPPSEYKNTRILIDHGKYEGLVDINGGFSVHVPEAGVYKVEAQNLNYFFEPVVVEIFETEDVKKQIKAFLFNIKEGRSKQLVYPLRLDPSHIKEYFEPVPPFNPMSLLMNPMVMMTGFSFAMTFLMKAMPKQDKKEMKKQMEEMKKQFGGNPPGLGANGQPECVIF